MRKWIGIICVLLGAICIISSVGFVAYNRWENKHAEEIAQDLLDDVQNIIDEFPTEQTVPDDTKKSPAEMTTVEVNGYDCIGILSVPALDLELPVLSDWSYAKLKKAPCHYYGSYYEKDLYQKMRVNTNINNYS